MKQRRIVSLFLAIGTSLSTVHAFEIPKYRYGLSAQTIYARSSYNGYVTKAEFIDTYSVYMIAQPTKYFRSGLELGYFSNVFPLEPNSLSETESMVRAAMHAEIAYPLTPAFTAWCGIGLVAEVGQHRNRFSLTQDAYLNAAYEDSGWGVDDVKPQLRLSGMFKKEQISLPFDIGVATFTEIGMQQGSFAAGAGLKILF